MLKKRLLLLGGGHSHALLLRSLIMKPLPDVEVVLVSPESLAPYSAMLPGYLAGHYAYDAMHIDLVQLCQAAGVRWIREAASGIDTHRHQVLFSRPCRPPLPYDTLSINVGSEPQKEDFGYGVKPMAPFMKRWPAVANASSVAVMGGGVGGVELALSLKFRYPHLQVSLVQRGPELLPALPAPVRQYFLKLCRQRGVKVFLGEPHPTQLARSSEIVLWATRAQGPAFLKNSELMVNGDGFLLTDHRLLCKAHQNIFAAGDCAIIEGQERPRSGVFAVRLAKPLRINIERQLRGQTLLPVRLQKQQLTIITSGSKQAVAVRGSFYWRSKAVWPLKDRIDRHFMAKFQNLGSSAMTQAPLNEGMRCLGCGAKVPGATLKAILKRLQSRYPEAFDENASLGMKEDVAVMAMPPRVMQSLDYFPAFYSDPFIFGQIACLHAAGDLIAKGGAPSSCLALAVLPYKAPALVEDDLFQMLAGVASILETMQARLIGGHSAEGLQMAVGLLMQGPTPAADQWRSKGGLQAGDVLVMTKALGTGIVLAGQMQNRTKGPWLDACLESMLQNHIALLPLIQSDGVHGCTDITGFGLLGHLAEMVQGSGVQVLLQAPFIPVLPGTRELIRAGVQSTLAVANDAYARDLCRISEIDADVWPLVCDPQSSGGLLLALDPDAAGDWIERAHAAGFLHTQPIGTVTGSGEPAIAWNRSAPSPPQGS